MPGGNIIGKCDGLTVNFFESTIPHAIVGRMLIECNATASYATSSSISGTYSEDYISAPFTGANYTAEINRGTYVQNQVTADTPAVFFLVQSCCCSRRAWVQMGNVTDPWVYGSSAEFGTQEQASLGNFSFGSPLRWKKTVNSSPVGGPPDPTSVSYVPLPAKFYTPVYDVDFLTPGEINPCRSDDEITRFKRTRRAIRFRLRGPSALDGPADVNYSVNVSGGALREDKGRPGSGFPYGHTEGPDGPGIMDVYVFPNESHDPEPFGNFDASATHISSGSVTDPGTGITTTWAVSYTLRLAFLPPL